MDIATAWTSRLGDAVGLAPGASLDGSGYGVHGARAADNAFDIAGLRLRGADALPMEFFRSVEVVTAGHDAEHRGTAGALVRPALRTGTNALRGSAMLRSTPGGGQVSGEIGGALKRDHVWLWAGIAPRRDHAGTAVPWATQMSVAARYDHQGSLTALSTGTGTHAAMVGWRSRFDDNRLTVDARAGWIAESAQPGAAQHEHRLAADTAVTRRQRLWGPHAFKAGVDVAGSRFARPGDPSSRDGDKAATGVDGDSGRVGAFVQDSWSVRPDLTINAGVRYDRYDAAPSVVSPRVGVAWDWTEEGRSKVVVHGGRYSPDDSRSVSDVGLVSVDYEFREDAVTGVSYQHRRAAATSERIRDAVSLFVSKSRGSLDGLASYTYAHVRDDTGAWAVQHRPHIVQLDGLYTWNRHGTHQFTAGVRVHGASAASAPDESAASAPDGSAASAPDESAASALDESVASALDARGEPAAYLSTGLFFGYRRSLRDDRTLDAFVHIDPQATAEHIVRLGVRFGF